MTSSALHQVAHLTSKERNHSQELSAHSWMDDHPFLPPDLSLVFAAELTQLVVSTTAFVQDPKAVSEALTYLRHLRALQLLVQFLLHQLSI